MHYSDGTVAAVKGERSAPAFATGVSHVDVAAIDRGALLRPRQQPIVATGAVRFVFLSLYAVVVSDEPDNRHRFPSP